MFLGLALALASCTKAGEAPIPEGVADGGGSLPGPTPGEGAPEGRAKDATEARSGPAPEPPAPAPTVVTAATLTRLGETPGPLTAALAFGAGDRWWHWDGQNAIEHRGASPEGAPLDADGLLAIVPKAAPGRPLVVSSSLVTADGVRALPDGIVYALRDEVSGYGGYEITEVAWAPDAMQVVIARSWRPGRCCRQREHERPPRGEVVEVHDVASGTKVELPGGAPLAIGEDRLLVRDTLYERRPLHPLDVPIGEPTSPAAVAIDATGAVLARQGYDGALELLRSDDGRPLRSWKGPALAGVLAFHPRHPLLAVASREQLALWRVDLEQPKRIANEALAETPSAIVFDPEGRRLFVTGRRGVVLDLALTEAPAGPEPSALQLDLEAPPPAELTWHVGRDVKTIGVGEDRVYAYSHGRGLVGFDRGSGTRVGSWRRNHDDPRGVAAASRAPIFAVVEDRWTRDPEARTQRLELLDASRWEVVRTRWLKLGQIAQLALSAHGTSFAWSLEGDPIVTLESAEGGGWLQLHANSNDVEAIAISDDDTRLAVANRHVERNVVVGTVGSEDVATITTPRGVSHLSFSPDGARLYVADLDGRVHVVDPGRAEVIATLEPGLRSINAMAVTADGTRLVVAYQEVVVLEVATGAEVRRLGGMDHLRSVAVSEDGTVIVAGTTHGVVRRFELR